MFRNQYLIASTDIAKTNFAGLDYQDFNGLRIHTHPTLDISLARCPQAEIAILGYVIDPFEPNKTNQNIADSLAGECRAAIDIFRKTARLSGRFVLLFKIGRIFYATGDACHFRQLYFAPVEGGLALTSSPKLYLNYFQLDMQTSKERADFTRLAAYRHEENAWYGDRTIDDRLRKVLPNHYLDINERKVKRIPSEVLPRAASDEEIVERASEVLRGTYTALTRRYKIIQPITAGWDSRILLSASKEVKDKIKFYVFSSSEVNPADVWIPRRLSESLGFAFEVIEPVPLTRSFLSKYTAEHIVPRILPKTAQIQYHYNQQYEKNTINVNGNAAEIARCFFGFTTQKITIKMLLAFSGYGNQSEFIRDQLEQWFPEANKYASEVGIPLLDLFYWEQRMGNWGAMFPFEQDIAVEEISPFNNRALIRLLLSIPPKGRRAPSYSFFRKLVENLWAETLTEEVNPNSRYVTEVIKGNSMARFAVVTALSKLKSIRSL